MEFPDSEYSDVVDKLEDTGILIPAMNEGFVPQGIAYWEEADAFFFSGYFNPAENSPGSALLAVDRESGKYVGEWILMNTDGTPHIGHDGGIAVTKKDIYISWNYTLFRISLETIKNSPNHGELAIEEEISVPVKASYCNCSSGYLWVGEYSKNGNKKYTITGHEYGENYAWTLGYKLDKSGNLSTVPNVIISTPEMIQGFTMLKDGRLFMVASSGSKDSIIYITQNSIDVKNANDYVELDGQLIPICTVGESDSFSVVPMGEGCISVGNEVYFVFESAAICQQDKKDPPSITIDSVYKFKIQ